jgi:hypothetical protein
MRSFCSTDLDPFLLKKYDLSCRQLREHTAIMLNYAFRAKEKVSESLGALFDFMHCLDSCAQVLWQEKFQSVDQQVIALELATTI